MSDILFKTDEYIFSYRAAGVCIQDGKVLLQKPSNDDGYAFPGGHVAFGETNAQTLAREFKEEINADISVGKLKWAAEIFFKWGNKPCHQICLYYDVKITDSHTPKDGNFTAVESLEGRNFDLEFCWIPLDKIKDIKVYPRKVMELLTDGSDEAVHFVDDSDL